MTPRLVAVATGRDRLASPCRLGVWPFACIAARRVWITGKVRIAARPTFGAGRIHVAALRTFGAGPIPREGECRDASRVCRANEIRVGDRRCCDDRRPRRANGICGVKRRGGAGQRRRAAEVCVSRQGWRFDPVGRVRQGRGLRGTGP
jgi:hypothetical protein